MAIVYGKQNKGAKRTAPKKPKGVTGKDAPAEDGLYNTVEKLVEGAISDTGTWSSRQEKWHKLRMRIKKQKTFPFVGSSNIRMPTAEKNIRKIKAAIMNIVFGIRPIVQVLPTPSGNRDSALKIEKFIDHLVMDVIGIEEKAEIGVDQSLEKGFHLLKPYWRLEITKRKEEIDINKLSSEEVLAIHTADRASLLNEIIARLDVDVNDKIADDNIKAIDKAVDEIREGKEVVQIMVKDITYNFPDIANISPERCYVPTDSGYNPQMCQGIVHEFYIPLHHLKFNVEEKGWSKGAIDDIEELETEDADKLTDTQKDMREGISRLNKSKMVKIWEWYGWYDINNDGVKEKCVCTIAPEFKKILRKVTLNNLSGKFPFVKLFYELTDDRWFSHRGIPEILEDIIKEIDVQHNMKIDSQTIRNAPMFVYRTGMVNPNLVQMIPNQGIPVNGLQPLEDTIKALNLHNPNVEYSYEREQMLLETQVQETLGQVDFSLQSTINRREPRTLGEVQEQVSNAGRVFSLDAKHYINQFSELFNFIFELWCEFGDDEYEFNYFGNSAQGETIKLTKEELQGKYIIKIRGNDQNTNPQARREKASQILLAATNPLLLQAGVVDPQKMANAVKRFFQALEVEEWEELINAQPQPQQTDPTQDIKIKTDDLTDSEVMQILQRRGIRADSKGRIINRKKEEFKEAAEIASKVG